MLTFLYVTYLKTFFEFNAQYMNFVIVCVKCSVVIVLAVSSSTLSVFKIRLIMMPRYWKRKSPKCKPEYILLNSAPPLNRNIKCPTILINRMFGWRSAIRPACFVGCTCIYNSKNTKTIFKYVSILNTYGDMGKFI